MSDKVIKPEVMSTNLTGLDVFMEKQNQELLKKLHIVVVGIGGVGSWTVEAFARSEIRRNYNH